MRRTKRRDKRKIRKKREKALGMMLAVDVFS